MILNDSIPSLISSLQAVFVKQPDCSSTFLRILGIEQPVPSCKIQFLLLVIVETAIFFKCDTPVFRVNVDFDKKEFLIEEGMSIKRFFLDMLQPFFPSKAAFFDPFIS